jgi:hypothetical protein
MMSNITSKKPHMSIKGNWVFLDDTVEKAVDTTTVCIMGIMIPIKYRIHDPSYVEWSMETAADKDEFTVEERELLNVLLRVHYGGFIEAALREAAFYENYANSQVSDNYDYWIDDYMKFATSSKLFTDEDIPF